LDEASGRLAIGKRITVNGNPARTVRESVSRLPGSRRRPARALAQLVHATAAGHLPGLFFFSPVFHQGELMVFVPNVGHHVDVSGILPGSQAVGGVAELYQEGLRLLPLNLYKAGQMVLE